MNWLIEKVYNYSEHKSSDEPNSISTTTLIGDLYKAKLALEKTPKEPLNPIYKRSSTIGSGFHMWAERALADDPNILTELYREKRYGKYLITGSCDLLIKEDDETYTIGDWKTGYGKERTVDQLNKDKLQMSVYRWLLSDEFDINDLAHTFFISQSNNVQEVYDIPLIPLDKMDDYLYERFYLIENNTKVDCQDGKRYNACTYCEFICKERKL